MKLFIIIVIVMMGICILVEGVKALAAKKKKNAPAGYPMATGCGSRESCRYLNLGRAAKAGKPEGYCWCEYDKKLLKRRDHCKSFESRGCAEGMCIYADFQMPKAEGYSSKYCYCSHYNQIFEGKTTCPYYVDHFETPEGNELRKVLQSL